MIRIMMLPNVERALVEREKIVEYLLDGAHPDNGGKANFFERLGFEKDQWQLLADAVKVAAASFPISVSMESAHGIKYILEGNIVGPTGIIGTVRIVWIIDCGKDVPRLVTAYPI